eukprot:CAMPEP_0179063856 /NCGR_PEP_ID=MMETSP0796-20121207/27652_1 /TAXON_ID=73915 /ORGANISM="Pyrodinium bahamense, Strain pbaha01" /LENGTH=326 /DNA_ID=CAMNT_0020760793 /DNA_START=54 /DNA_END=1034 /DNA_ORIENTATION=+
MIWNTVGSLPCVGINSSSIGRSHRVQQTGLCSKILRDGRRLALPLSMAGVALLAQICPSLGRWDLHSTHSAAAVPPAFSAAPGKGVIWQDDEVSWSTPTAQVDYLIDQSWVQGAYPRVLELAPPEGSPNEPIRRLIMPRRLEDAHFLRLLSTEHLRVDLWPHRTPELHMHVRVFTDALSFYPAAEPRRGLWARWSSPDRRWLLLLQAVVHLPHGVALLGCSPEWRWAGVNETEPQVLGGAGGDPFRILEVACPRRPRGFLLPKHTGGPGLPVGSRRAPKDMLISGLRLAFLVMLIMVCIAQVVLLLICITMLLVQLGIQRGRPAAV